MAAYRYKALNSQGKVVKGVLEGDSDRHIRSQLRTKQLRPIEVEVAGVRLKSNKGFRLSLFRPGLKVGEVALITRQLATLVASALPLDEC